MKLWHQKLDLDEKIKNSVKGTHNRFLLLVLETHIRHLWSGVLRKKYTKNFPKQEKLLWWETWNFYSFRQSVSLLYPDYEDSGSASERKSVTRHVGFVSGSEPVSLIYTDPTKPISISLRQAHQRGITSNQDGFRGDLCTNFHCPKISISLWIFTNQHPIWGCDGNHPARVLSQDISTTRLGQFYSCLCSLMFRDATFHKKANATNKLARSTVVGNRKELQFVMRSTIKQPNKKTSVHLLKETGWPQVSQRKKDNFWEKHKQQPIYRKPVFLRQLLDNSNAWTATFTHIGWMAETLSLQITAQWTRFAGLSLRSVSGRWSY